MASSMVGISDDEFVGYHFSGVPERRHRLWFLDRELYRLALWGTYTIAVDADIVGMWTTDMRKHLQDGRYSPEVIRDQRIVAALQREMPGLLIRWEDSAGRPMMWKLTDVTIPKDPSDAARGFGIHTFGRDDDIWRLGVWPD